MSRPQTLQGNIDECMRSVLNEFLTKGVTGKFFENIETLKNVKRNKDVLIESCRRSHKKKIVEAADEL